MTNEFTIMNPVVEHLIFPTIATIVGTIAGGYLAYRFGILLAHQAELRREADSFFNAIFPALTELKQRLDVDTCEILKKHYPVHQRAFERFSMFLDERTRAALQKDWQVYLWADGLNVPFLEKYAECGQIDKRSVNCSMAIANLEAVIRYAGHVK